MQLLYEGKDITRYVDILRCIHRDIAGGRSDCLELELDHADAWYHWQPAPDDRIAITHDGYDTGTLYMNTILPEEGRYRILATSLPSRTYRKAWSGFENQTLDSVMNACSAQCQMGYALYGLEGTLQYPFLLREDEGCAAFLQRLMEREGAVLKTVNGNYTGISIPYAQDLPARQTIRITAKQPGVRYIRRAGVKYAGIVIQTPYTEVTATDTDVETGAEAVPVFAPVTDAVTAGRWARGLLLHHNRKAETLHMPMELNTGITALMRINIDSTTDADGAWIVEEAEHDLFHKKTAVKLLRCLTGIQ